MLEKTDHYKLGLAALQMAADSFGRIWFLVTSDEIFTHDRRRRTTELVASANDASSVALAPSKAVYGTWGGEIWSVNFDSRKVEKLLALPRSSFVAKLVVDSGSGMIFCSTKSEIFGIGIDGSVSHRIPIEFVEELIVVGDGLWFLKQGRISLWNIRNNHVSMVSKSVNYILLRHAMNGLIAGLGGDVDLLNEEGQIVESIPGSVNQLAWDARNCVWATQIAINRSIFAAPGIPSRHLIPIAFRTQALLLA